MRRTYMIGKAKQMTSLIIRNIVFGTPEVLVPYKRMLWCRKDPRDHYLPTFLLTLL